jgi:CHAD domain-containing protein
MAAKLAPPLKAVSPPLTADMSVSRAFQAVFASCLAQLEGNRAGVLRGEDIEYVHQMRVAIRRLRSALRLFRTLVPTEILEPLNDELRWLGGQLGEARDWDVLVEETLPPRLAEFPAHQGLKALAEQAAALRLEKREAARRAARSPRCRKLLARLRVWIAAEGWREHSPAKKLDRPAPNLAAKLLTRRHKALRERGKGLAGLPPAERHLARIAAKKLRYATEFFSPLFPGPAAKNYAKALADLQDLLGTLNDAAVTHRLLAELGEGSGAALLGDLVDLAAEENRGHLGDAWKRFGRRRPFWKA